MRSLKVKGTLSENLLVIHGCWRTSAAVYLSFGSKASNFVKSCLAKLTKFRQILFAIRTPHRNIPRTRSRKNERAFLDLQFIGFNSIRRIVERMLSIVQKLKHNDAKAPDIYRLYCKPDTTIIFEANHITLLYSIFANNSGAI